MYNYNMKIVWFVIMIMLFTVVSTGCKKSDPTNSLVTSKSTADVLKNTGKTTTKSTTETTGKNTTTVKNATLSDIGDIDSEGNNDQDIGDLDENSVEEEILDFGGIDIVFFYPKNSAPNPDRNAAQTAYSIALCDRIADTEQKYNVKLSFVNYTGSTSYWEYIRQVALAGAFVGDVLTCQASDIHLLVNNNVIIKLDNYIDFSSPLNDTIPHQQVSFFRCNYWGYVNTPVLGGQPTMMYNKDIFSKEGLPDAVDLMMADEWNYSKFLELAIFATKDVNGDGIIDQWGLDDTSPNAAWTIQVFLQSNGGKVFNYIKDDGLFEYAYNHPNALKSLQFWSDLVNVYKVMPPYIGNLRWGKKTGPYYTGTAAMAIAQVSTKGPVPMDSVFVAFPKGPDTDKYNFYSGTWFWAVSSLSKYPAEAAKVMEKVYCSWDIDRPGYIDPNDPEYLKSFCFPCSDGDSTYNYVYNVMRSNASFPSPVLVPDPTLNQAVFNDAINKNIPFKTVLDTYNNAMMNNLNFLNNK